MRILWLCMLLCAGPWLFCAESTICQHVNSIDNLFYKGSEDQFTSEERGLVKKLWDILAHKRTKKKLTEFLMKDFRYTDISGRVFHRNEYIKDILKSPSIESYIISKLTLVRKKDLIFAYYSLGLKNPQFHSRYVPSAQMNVFQKEKGKWKLLSIADLDLFNM